CAPPSRAHTPHLAPHSLPLPPAVLLVIATPSSLPKPSPYRLAPIAWPLSLGHRLRAGTCPCRPLHPCRPPLPGRFAPHLAASAIYAPVCPRCTRTRRVAVPPSHSASPPSRAPAVPFTLCRPPYAVSRRRLSRRHLPSCAAPAPRSRAAAGPNWPSRAPWGHVVPWGVVFAPALGLCTRPANFCAAPRRLNPHSTVSRRATPSRAVSRIATPSPASPRALPGAERYPIAPRRPNATISSPPSLCLYALSGTPAASSRPCATLAPSRATATRLCAARTSPHCRRITPRRSRAAAMRPRVTATRAHAANTRPSVLFRGWWPRAALACPRAADTHTRAVVSRPNGALSRSCDRSRVASGPRSPSHRPCPATTLSCPATPRHAPPWRAPTPPSRTSTPLSHAPALLRRAWRRCLEARNPASPLHVFALPPCAPAPPYPAPSRVPSGTFSLAVTRRLPRRHPPSPPSRALAGPPSRTPSQAALPRSQPVEPCRTPQHQCRTSRLAASSLRPAPSSLCLAAPRHRLTVSCSAVPSAHPVPPSRTRALSPMSLPVAPPPPSSHPHAPLTRPAP
ncbi:hypothetical protein DENSPDRAFT_886863, partial [Dentipellis sp. KUC8613]